MYLNNGHYVLLMVYLQSKTIGVVDSVRSEGSHGGTTRTGVLGPRLEGIVKRMWSTGDIQYFCAPCVGQEYQNCAIHALQNLELALQRPPLFVDAAKGTTVFSPASRSENIAAAPNIEILRRLLAHLVYTCVEPFASRTAGERIVASTVPFFTKNFYRTDHDYTGLPGIDPAKVIRRVCRRTAPNPPKVCLVGS